MDGHRRSADRRRARRRSSATAPAFVIDNIVAPDVCRAVGRTWRRTRPRARDASSGRPSRSSTARTGRPASSGLATVRLDAPVARSTTGSPTEQDAQVTAASRIDAGWNAFLLVLFVLGVLLLIVQGAARRRRRPARAIDHLGRARAVRRHRARARRATSPTASASTRSDQLGDLAESFNRMSASIEHLLHVQREKQRLDDELRIAREIQKSLLPVAAAGARRPRASRISANRRAKWAATTTTSSSSARGSSAC